MKQHVKKLIPQAVKRQIRQLMDRRNFISAPRYKAPLDESPNVLASLIAYNKYGGYCVPRSSLHRPAAQCVLNGEVFEPQTIEYMLAHCKEGDIVHAGTYFGDFLPALSRGCSSATRIWAFEPNSENYQCAEITIRLNRLNNVYLCNAGLGKSGDTLSMQTADALGRSLGGGSHILGGAHTAGGDGIETVQVVSVDETVPDSRAISIIQLDVEHYEKPALSGALETIRRCLPILILETLPEPGWFSSNVLDLGYRQVGTVHGNAVFACEST